MELGLRQLGSQAWPSHLREPASSLSLCFHLYSGSYHPPHIFELVLTLTGGDMVEALGSAAPEWVGQGGQL